MNLLADVAQAAKPHVPLMPHNVVHLDAPLHVEMDAVIPAIHVVPAEIASSAQTAKTDAPLMPQNVVHLGAPLNAEVDQDAVILVNNVFPEAAAQAAKTYAEMNAAILVIIVVPDKPAAQAAKIHVPLMPQNVVHLGAPLHAEVDAAILVLSAVLTKHVPKLLAHLLPRHRHQQLRPHH